MRPAGRGHWTAVVLLSRKTLGHVMYAVIKTGGKQYKVAKDQIVIVEKLSGETGDSVAFEQILMVGDEAASTVGTPYVAGASVTAEVLGQDRDEKIVVFKKKRRKNYRRRKGHRQDQTVLRITDILTDGKKPSKAKAAKTEAAKPEAPKPEAAEDAKEPAAKAAKKPEAAPKAKAAAKKPAPAKAAAGKAKKPATKKPAAKKSAGKAAKESEG